MPRGNTSKKVKEQSNTPSTQKSIEELREWYAKYEHQQEMFATVKQAIQLANLTKRETRTFNTFSKERLRVFLKNPKSYEGQLRNLSRFLYRVSHVYRRLINYNAQMMDLSAQSIIPLRTSLIEQDDETKYLQNYYDTAKEIQKISLKDEIYKCLVIAWKEDCFYGYTYEDDTGFFIMPLDGDYCKVSSVNYDDTLNFAFDFSYFRVHQDALDYWDREFRAKYEKYLNEPATMRWQELDRKRTICLKVNIDDPTFILPPYMALFEPLIDLIDLQSIQSVKDELAIYKLLVARLKPLSGTDMPDDFEVDIDTALEYYDKLSEALPDSVASVVSPLPIEAIEFKGTDSSDVDMISNSTSNLFKTSGGSLILNDEKSGTTIYQAQILSDTLNALIPLLPQVEKWINRYLTYRMGEHSHVKYLTVSPYTKEKVKDQMIKSGQYGIPEKMAIAALDGFSPLEILSLQYLENDLLKLHEKWIPLQSSYTTSWTGISDASNTKEDDDLTDEGSDTRENSKNEMG